MPSTFFGLKGDIKSKVTHPFLGANSPKMSNVDSVSFCLAEDTIIGFPDEDSKEQGGHRTGPRSQDLSDGAAVFPEGTNRHSLVDSKLV